MFNQGRVFPDPNVLVDNNSILDEVQNRNANVISNSTLNETSNTNYANIKSPFCEFKQNLKGLTVGHINIISLLNYIDQLRMYD